MGLNLDSLIESIGTIGVFLIIFLETGILFGILLPGDMLLFAAGALAAHGTFDISVIAFGCFCAAFLGNIVGYELGRYLGLPFVRKYATSVVTEDHLHKTHRFFERYGRSGLIIARFITVARTIIPFLAGMSRMNYHDFIVYSAVGAALWGMGLPIAGYFLAGFIPHEFIDYILLPIIFCIVLIMAWPWIKKQLNR